MVSVKCVVVVVVVDFINGILLIVVLGVQIRATLAAAKTTTTEVLEVCLPCCVQKPALSLSVNTS